MFRQIIKVPGIKGKGNILMRNTGNKIIEEMKKLIKNDIEIEEIHVNNEDLEEQEELIHENSFEAFEKNELTIFLGGDEVIIEPIVLAFNEAFKGRRVRVLEKNTGIKIQELFAGEDLKGLIVSEISEKDEKSIKLAAVVAVKIL